MACHHILIEALTWISKLSEKKKKEKKNRKTWSWGGGLLRGTCKGVGGGNVSKIESYFIIYIYAILKDKEKNVSQQKSTREAPLRQVVDVSQRSSILSGEASKQKNK